MENLSNKAEFDLLVKRVENLQQSAERIWGKMTLGQMVCHLTDPLRDILGERITEPVIPEDVRPQLVQMVITASEWDQNLPTFEPYDQGPEGGGTKPGSFNIDKAKLLELMHKFHSADDSYTYYPHAGLGLLSRQKFGAYLWKHIDHHLRQFGA